MNEVLIFAAQTLIIFLAVAAIVVMIAVIIARNQQGSDLEITPLHEKWKDLKFFMKSFVLSKDELKGERKKLKKERKAEEKHSVPHSTVFVLRFDGDVKANQVESLREEINSILQIASAQDEVVVVLESPGGMVSTYGLGASQLLRLRDRGVKLTVCVDVVAASGGYLMAVTAHQILAAPFAIIGSIGVIAQVPNFHKLLKRHDIEYKEYTAGEFKRTVSLFGEITPAGEAKFKEQLEETHVLFKDFVQRYRPNLQLQQIATGEYWYGERALQLGLIDGIKTSDEYLLERAAEKKPVFEISFNQKVPLSEKLADFMGSVLQSLSNRISKEAAKTGF